MKACNAMYESFMEREVESMRKTMSTRGAPAGDAGKYPTKEIEHDEGSIRFTIKDKCLFMHTDSTKGRERYYDEDYGLSEADYAGLICGCIRQDELIFFKYPSYGPYNGSVNELVECFRPLLPNPTLTTVYNGVVV